MALRINSGLVQPPPGQEKSPGGMALLGNGLRSFGHAISSMFSGKPSNLNSGGQALPSSASLITTPLGQSPLIKYPQGTSPAISTTQSPASSLISLISGANPGMSQQRQTAAAQQPTPATADNPWNHSANSDYSYQPDPSLQQSQDAGYPAFQGNWADYLAQAQKVAGSNIANQLAALAASRDQINQGYQLGDKQLADMYSALQASTQQANSEAAARYVEAQKAVQAQTDQAQAALSGANSAVAGSQDLTNANLNNKLVNPNGGLSVAQQAQLDAAQANNSRLQQQGQNAYDSMVSGGQEQQTYGTAMANAAQFAGADRRSQLKQALLSALASVAQQEAQLKDSQGQQASSLASQMYNNDYNAWKDNRDYQANRSDQAWQQAYQQQQLDNSAARNQMQYGGGGVATKGPDAAMSYLQGPGGLNAQDSAAVTQAILNAIAQNQGSVGSGGKSLTPYQAGMVGVNSLDPSLKGVAMMALYQMTGGF